MTPAWWDQFLTQPVPIEQRGKTLPNYIRNVLTAHGPAEIVAKFVAQAKGRPPRTGDKPLNPDGTHNSGYHKDEPAERDFCFSRLVPLPARFSQVPYGDGAKGCGYDLECETWGIKWGAFTIQTPIIDAKLVTYRFETAWHAPIDKFLPQVARDWPDLKFLINWGGEGPVRGHGAAHGKKAEFKCYEYNDGSWPKEDPTLTEEQNIAREKFHTYHLVLHHARILARVISSVYGYWFKEDVPNEVLADWLEDNEFLNHAVWLRGDATKDKWWERDDG